MAARPPPVTWAQAFRDIGIRFLSSGKFNPTLAFILILAAIIKAPRDKIPEIIKTLSERSVMWQFMGWFTAAAILLCFIVLFLLKRKIYLNEIDRVKNERDQLQEKLTDHTLQHSRFKGGQA